MGCARPGQEPGGSTRGIFQEEKPKKAKLIAGIVLILLGAVTLYYRGIPYTKKEDVLKIGDLTAQVQTKETYEIHPAVSGLVLAGGIVLVVLAFRKKS